MSLGRNGDIVNLETEDYENLFVSLCIIIDHQLF